jgi:hypothetical protein
VLDDFVTRRAMMPEEQGEVEVSFTENLPVLITVPN